MERLCPQCMSALSLSAKNALVCPGCGGQYAELFLRPAVPPASQAPIVQPQPVASGPAPLRAMVPAQPVKVTTQCPSCGKRRLVEQVHVGREDRCDCGATFRIEPCDDGIPVAPVFQMTRCLQHPGVTAQQTCSQCGSAMCDLCAMPRGDGTVVCPSCAVVPPPAVPLGTKCRTHPDVQAVFSCKVCGAATCSTCDFLFPGDVHLCPACATSSQKGGVGKRKWRLVWAFVLAGWGALALVLLMVVAPMMSPSGVQALGMVIGLLGFGPSLAGMGLGIACFDHRMGNPPVIWVAAISSIVVAVAWLLLVVVGTLMG